MTEEKVSHLKYWLKPMLLNFKLKTLYRQKKITYYFDNGNKITEYWLEQHKLF